MTENLRAGTRPGRRILEVRGADRVGWLNGLLTCDVSKLAPGHALHGLVVARKGKIMSDVLVAAPHGTDLLVLDLDAAAAAAAHEHLEHHLITEDVEMTLRDAAPIVQIGPNAGASARLVMRGLVGAPEVEAGLRFDDAPFTGDEGVYEDLRFLAGWPAFGLDYDDAFYPQEAGLETFAVAFDKGCYLGQEVVFMLQVRGKVKRRLALLELGPGSAPAFGTVVTLPGGKEVGETRTARILPGATRAFALLREGTWKPGTELLVAGAAARVLG